MVMDYLNSHFVCTLQILSNDETEGRRTFTFTSLKELLSSLFNTANLLSGTKPYCEHLPAACIFWLRTH